MTGRTSRIALRAAAGATLALFVLCLLSAAASDAYARGGGGGGWGGGGGGGGSGGDGDGGAILYLIYLLVRFLLVLCVEAPVVGIPLTLAVLAILAWLAFRTERGTRKFVASAAASRSHGVHSRIALGEMLRTDPAFDETSFLARARAAFHAVQDGWCSHDLTKLHAFCSDGVAERFAIQIAEQRSLGYRDEMKDVAVQSAVLEGFDLDGAVECLTVRIAARARDYRVSLRDGSFAGGNRDVVPFAESWTFARRRGARTKTGAAGLIEGNCPNCAAPIGRSQWAKCAACGALLRSGEHDWVLVEITQAFERTRALTGVARAVDALAATDPSISAQGLEDRAAVLFWRHAAALRLGSRSSLAGHSLPEPAHAAETWSAREAGESGVRRWPGECAVGSVSLARVARRDGFDFALFQVRWQGMWFEARGSGPPRRTGRIPTQTSLLVAMRETPKSPRTGGGFDSAHCPRCGAPETALGESACGSCGVAFGPQNRWVLADWNGSWVSGAAAWCAKLPPPDAGPAPAPTPEPDRPPTRTDVLEWLASVARSDGRVTENERIALHAVATKAGVRPDHADRLLFDPVVPAAGGAAPRPLPGEEAQWMRLAAEMAASDGAVEPSERAALRDIGRACGLAAADVNLAVRRAEADVFRRSAQTLIARR
ncbi:MAG: hypothetical protein HMLKMBBP_03554 [Planctomycetes bacterium]|nr:hypothetical protein [Planctomycetota bacterium]